MKLITSIQRRMNIFANLNRCKNGVSMIELIVYIGLLLVVTSLISIFVYQTIRIQNFISMKEETISNCKNALDTIGQEIKSSQSIYTKTSVFDINPGQLSLEKGSEEIPQEKTTFVDFYIDNGRLYRKEEQKTEELLISEKMRITNLIFTHLNPGDAPNIQINITCQYDTPSSLYAKRSEISLTTTFSLRNY